MELHIWIQMACMVLHLITWIESIINQRKNRHPARSRHSSSSSSKGLSFQEELVYNDGVCIEDNGTQTLHCSQHEWLAYIKHNRISIKNAGLSSPKSCITSSSYLASLDDNSSFCKKVGEESNVLQGTVPNMLKMKLEDICSHIIEFFNQIK